MIMVVSTHIYLFYVSGKVLPISGHKLQVYLRYVEQHGPSPLVDNGLLDLTWWMSAGSWLRYLSHRRLQPPSLNSWYNAHLFINKNITSLSNLLLCTVNHNICIFKIFDKITYTLENIPRFNEVFFYQSILLPTFIAIHQEHKIQTYIQF